MTYHERFMIEFGQTRPEHLNGRGYPIFCPAYYGYAEPGCPNYHQGVWQGGDCYRHWDEQAPPRKVKIRLKSRRKK